LVLCSGEKKKRQHRKKGRRGRKKAGLAFPPPPPPQHNKTASKKRRTEKERKKALFGDSFISIWVERDGVYREEGGSKVKKRKSNARDLPCPPSPKKEGDIGNPI